MTDYPEIEIKLQEVMAKRKIRTIEKLHQMSGLSRKAISKALSGKPYKMNIETISKLCAALDCEIGELLELKKGE
ncbi:helix-turn-helix domain-containing protein [Bacillus testis]|uniref:helix-turn-helix domain-containing protein n=1 Tax=Bacillus testis TaxID=1622072 RepID=UPI00067F488C|nr:helix-turn-helix transcriptional regulator [Bacillus testis]